MEMLQASEKTGAAVEQRGSPRFAMALHLTVDDEDGTESGLVHDLSGTGLCFQSDRSYAPGSQLRLVLEFAEHGRSYPLRCEAEVVRAVTAGDDFNIAVRLLTPLFP